MALQSCPDCEKQVSSTAFECPNCGAILRERPRITFGQVLGAILIAALIVGFILSMLGRA